MNSQKYLFATFCDDIRREEGNKLTYVGIYGAKLGVSAFPSLIPRLCAALVMTVPPNDVPSSLIFRLYKNDELIAQAEVPAAALETSKSATLTARDDQIMRFRSFMQLTPAQFTEPCFLRARALCDGVEFRGGSLEIVDQREFATPSPAPTVAD